MYGYEVPRNNSHAIALDTRNDNTKWKDSTNLEMEQLREHQYLQDALSTQSSMMDATKLDVLQMDS